MTGCSSIRQHEIYVADDTKPDLIDGKVFIVAISLEYMRINQFNFLLKHNQFNNNNSLNK